VELISCDTSGAWNFDMSHTFLLYLCTPALVYLDRLFNDAISISDYTESKDRAIRNNVLERPWKETVFVTLRYYPSNYWSD
jgi:hypothetical protein